MVDSQNLDAVSVIAELPARSTARRVPASNGSGATNVGKVGELALCLVLGHEAVTTVGAGHLCHGSATVVVASVPSD